MLYPLSYEGGGLRALLRAFKEKLSTKKSYRMALLEAQRRRGGAGAHRRRRFGPRWVPTDGLGPRWGRLGAARGAYAAIGTAAAALAARFL